MPLPRALGRLNRRVTNPALEPVLMRLPGFGRVIHVGRQSGAIYRTPMLAFRHGDRVTFALTYGARADWVQNVLASGACTFETRRSTIRLSAPTLYRDPARRAVPRAVRLMLGILRVDEFLRLSTANPQRIQNDRKLQRSRSGLSGTV